MENDKNNPQIMNTKKGDLVPRRPNAASNCNYG